MSLNLPQPVAPAAQGAAHSHVKAWRHWQQASAAAQRQQWPQAARGFAQAHALHGGVAYGLAAVHALIKAGQAEAAQQQAQALIAQQPACGQAYTLRAQALLELGRPAEAAQALASMPAQLARDRAHWQTLALAQQRAHRHDDAIQSFMQALALKVDDAVCHFHLGLSFKELGMKAEAAECIRTAVTLGLGRSGLAARGLLCFLEREACRWPQAEAELAELQARTAALAPGQPMEHAAFACAVLSDDPAFQRRAAEHHALHVARQVRPLPARMPRAHDGRLRLGYLSADFHTHATSQLMVQMLQAHDRSRFEVSLFSSGPDDGSPMRRRIEAASEHFVHLRGQPFAAMAQAIRERHIDVLVDLKGQTHLNLLPVLAHRPAPLQLQWLGHPGTVGAPYIDYVVGDPIVTPLADAGDFSEHIAQLPRCYQPNDLQRERPAADARATWGLRDDELVLCGFHQPYKLSREVWDTWCALLQQLPQARLWLLHWNSNVQGTLLAAAAERGVAPERLLFAPVLPLAQHLARLACADVYLDAWPCNAHTTASEALWMGVPVVSLTGRTFASRVAASLLARVGLPELACASLPDYQATVLALAEPARRAALRSHLAAQRGPGSLFDGECFARDFEALVLRLWQHACTGQPARAFAAAPMEVNT